MADDYTAYEMRAIAKAGHRVQEAAVSWAVATRSLNKAYLRSGDFGVVGDEAKVPLNYANVVSSTIDVIDEGVENLRKSALALFEVAKVYEENEENTRRQIWFGRGLSPESWALSGRHQKDD